MKTKLPVIAVIALLVSACGTGTYTTRAYDDDIYFSPKDAPPVFLENEATAKNDLQKNDVSKTREQDLVVSQIKTNPDGTKTLRNDILQTEKGSGNDHVYDMGNQELVDSDTTAYVNDNEVKYVINNYYDGDELDYSERINMFHRPFFYSPYYSYRYNWPYMSDYYWNWGSSYIYDPYFSSYYGWYDPWCWDYPFGLMWDSFYFGGYGYWGYHWLDNTYSGINWGGLTTYNIERRRDTNMTLERQRMSSGREFSNERSSVQRASQAATTLSRSRQVSGIDTKNATIVNDRRSGESSQGRRAMMTTERSGSTFTRPVQTNRSATNISESGRRSTYSTSTSGRTYSDGQSVRSSQSYTPSYNRPRVVNQANYNNSSYSRSRSVTSGSVSSGRSQSVSTPQSSSSIRQTYNSSSTYSTTPSYSPRGASYQSSSSGSGRSFGNNSGGSSTSTPSFSSGGGSSGGGGYSSGGSGGGGGGGSGSRR